MSTTNVAVAVASPKSTLRPLPAAGAAIVVAALTSFYGAYGDPHPSTSQEHGVPIVIGIGVVLAGLIFGLLVPWAARTIARGAGFGLALSIVGLIAIPVTFWSGFNIVIAGAGALLGLHARRTAARAGRPTGLGTAAATIGVIAMVLSTAMVVLGNTVLA
jgi:hypothetical protein